MVTMHEARQARIALDSRLAPLGSADEFAVPRSGWVRAIRDALGMPAAALGRRMGVSQPAVFDLERSEQNGTAGLDTLKRAAEALDCDLVYAFIPRHGLEATVRSRAEDLADADLRHVVQSMALEDQAESVHPRAREDLIQQLLQSRGLWSRKA